jgi:hypothetical protein
VQHDTLEVPAERGAALPTDPAGLTEARRAQLVQLADEASIKAVGLGGGPERSSRGAVFNVGRTFLETKEL